jgi:hypothetical protein
MRIDRRRLSEVLLVSIAILVLPSPYAYFWNTSATGTISIRVGWTLSD